MDKFVIRKPGFSFPRGKTQPPDKQKKQSCIEDLAGVVVVEDILRLKAKLLLENQSCDVLIESLQELGKKIPCKKVMMSSKIGHAVNKLRKHDNSDVVKEAKKVYTKWRTYYKELRDRPQIEVKYGKKGEEMRSSGRKFLAKALSLEVDSSLVELIEREVVHVCNRRLDNTYRKTMRMIVFALRNRGEVRSNVISGQLSVEDFVKQYKK